MRKTLVLSVVLIALVLLGAFFTHHSFNQKETVYVGVTYCGNSVENAKLLIDKVKGYTNLFVLQSGILQRNLESVDELGDYAVSAGMYFLPYFGHYMKETFSPWLESAKQKWGTKFLGVYFSDEPAGKMLDDYVEFRNETTGESILKTRYGDVVLEKPDGVIIHYEISGVIHLSLPAESEDLNTTAGSEKGVYATFYPDGSIEVDESNATLASIQIANLPDYATYEQLQNVKPLKDINETANKFVSLNQDLVDYLSNSTTVLSSDYALYWFDYLKGYDVMLGHLGWNHTFSQQIALLRGAAKLQNKDWGVVVTWKYSKFPYLDSGPEIFNQLKDAYECGAKYFVVFNFYNDNSNPYGTMQDEHYEALESFWNGVVKNPNVAHGSVSADSVLVLPENYGWGTRAPQDKIWGIFKPDDKTQQIWNLIQSVLADHGLQTDIVYEDSRFPLAPEYTHIYYWNQT